MKRVVVIQRVLPHYRHDFFDGVERQLSNEGYEFVLYYGQERDGEVPRTKPLVGGWARFSNNWYILRGALVFQSALFKLKVRDVVVVESASRCLINYVLMVMNALRLIDLVFWGHGKNFQTSRVNPIAELVKKHTALMCRGWLAYTELSRDFIRSYGVPNERITVLNNSQKDDSTLSFEDRQELFDRMNLSLGLKGVRRAVFCGGMYPEKRLTFLLESMSFIAGKDDGFEFILIGDGPELAGLVKEWAGYDWVHFLGARYGDEKRVLIENSDLIVMPGLVGLVIIESFYSGCPMITTKNDLHSPEICYLRDGYNGCYAPNGIQEFAEFVSQLLNDRVELGRLSKNCASSAKIYAIDNMIDNFCAGIKRVKQ